MVDEVGADDAPHVGAPRRPGVTDAPVHDHVVEDEVGEAVRGHPEADGERHRVAVGAGVDEDDRRDREEDAEEVVPLEPGVVPRAVVRLVEHPERAVHEVLVHQVRHGLHADQGDGEDGGLEQHEVAGRDAGPARGRAGRQA